MTGNKVPVNLYAELFGTEKGQKVLADLMNRFGIDNIETDEKLMYSRAGSRMVLQHINRAIFCAQEGKIYEYAGDGKFVERQSDDTD